MNACQCERVCVCLCLARYCSFVALTGSLLFVPLTCDCFPCTLRLKAVLGAARPPEILINYCQLTILFSLWRWTNDSSATSADHNRECCLRTLIHFKMCSCKLTSVCIGAPVISNHRRLQFNNALIGVDGRRSHTRPNVRLHFVNRFHLHVRHIVWTTAFCAGLFSSSMSSWSFLDRGAVQRPVRTLLFLELF